MKLLPIAWIWSTVQNQQPRLVNCAVGGVLCAGSDWVAQRIEQQQQLYGDEFLLEQRRMITAGCLGALFAGFVYPFAYSCLDKRFVGNGFRTLLQKSLLEIVTVGITVNTVSLGARGWLQQHAASDVFRHITREIPTVTLNDGKVWLPYNLIAFRFLPARIRPITTACMEAGWQTYISLRAHALQKHPNTEKMGVQRRQKSNTAAKRRPLPS